MLLYCWGKCWAKVSSTFVILGIVWIQERHVTDTGAICPSEANYNTTAKKYTRAPKRKHLSVHKKITSPVVRSTELFLRRTEAITCYLAKDMMQIGTLFITSQIIIAKFKFRHFLNNRGADFCYWLHLERCCWMTCLNTSMNASNFPY